MICARKKVNALYVMRFIELTGLLCGGGGGGGGVCVEIQSIWSGP